MIKKFNEFSINENSNTTKEYQEGLDAASRGEIPTDNPYEKDSKQYEDWLDGMIDGSL